MCHTDEDEDLWQSDPIEYIRVKYGEFQIVFLILVDLQPLPLQSTYLSTQPDILHIQIGWNNNSNLKTDNVVRSSIENTLQKFLNCWLTSGFELWKMNWEGQQHSRN